MPEGGKNSVNQRDLAALRFERSKELRNSKSRGGRCEPLQITGLK